MRKWKWPGAARTFLVFATVFALYGAERYQPAVDGSGALEARPDYSWIYEQETVPTQPKLPVSEEERRLLIGLYGAMEKKDTVGAATVLNENEEAFKRLADRSLNGERWLFYTERTAQGEILYRMWRMEEGAGGGVSGGGDAGATGTRGTGMVLTRFNTVFFGTFLDGSPAGECLAVQAVILDYPRFTFADGIWTDGKMNGQGTAGYQYYAGKPEGSFATVKKTGTYTDNLMDGDLVYEADNGSGRVLHWNITAAQGVTVLDERWSYYAYSDEYMLRSEEDEDRAYVVQGPAKEQILWNNLILWD